MTMRLRAGTPRAKPATRVRIVRVRDERTTSHRDVVAGEEPMEIRLLAGGRSERVAVTMRTPGRDFELAAGFLFGEGLIAGREDLAALRYCTDVNEDQRYNVVNVHLRGDALPDLARMERHFTVSSACGVCGKAHLDDLEVRCDGPLPAGPHVSVARLATLPNAMREAQGLFEATGGLHAAALFDANGTLRAVREDVGRHNAMDKLIGWALLEGGLPQEAIVCVSGRASYELLQKALAARLSFFAAISAPSSLAVDLARRFGVTLVGFLRPGGFNVYAGAERIQGLPPDA